MYVLRELECDLGPLQRRCTMLIGCGPLQRRCTMIIGCGLSYIEQVSLK